MVFVPVYNLGVKTRREILKALLGLASGCAVPAIVGAADFKRSALAQGVTGTPGAWNAALPTLADWTGDDFTLGHKLRSKKIPSFPAKAERNVDFVIVGGGMGGLSAAHYLNNHDFVLLEQYSFLGGNSRGGSFRNIDYSYGPVTIKSKDGIYGELYAALGISPRTVQPHKNNSFFDDGKWLSSLTTSDKDTLSRAFKRFYDANKSAINQLPKDDTPEAMVAAAFAPLASASFASLLKDSDPLLLGILDSVCKSNFCASADMISAAAGLQLMRDLAAPTYCFPGGNSAITAGIVKKLGGSGSPRLLTGTFVWQISLDDSGANILYTDAAGNPHNIRCRHVIVATPPMVAWRQFVNLSDAMRVRLMPFKYGSCLVSNLLLRKKIFQGGYENWIGQPFKLASIVDAGAPYELDGHHNKDGGSVLTIYQPWSPGSAGRNILIRGTRESLAKPVLDELVGLLHDLADNVEQIVLTRWGHAMPVPAPGYYTKLQAIEAGYDGPYTFAYGATQGMQCAESAIRAGKFAASRAMATSKKVSMVRQLLLAECLR
jgi:protoporphyrinogen oxidase